MVRRRLFFQIYPAFLLVLLVTIFLLNWYILGAVKTFYLQEETERLQEEANLVKDYILLKQPQSSADLDSACRHLAVSAASRITVIEKSGLVLADSEEDPSKMDNHADRKEIITAMQGNTGTSIRYSFTLEQDMLYLAVPLEKTDTVNTVLRLSRPLSSLEAAFLRIEHRIIYSSIIIAMLAAIITFLISRRISRPLEEIREGAEKFAESNFEQKLPLTGTAEIASLAKTLNSMANQLSERIRTISLQRNEQEAMLSSMVEGILAVDNEERVIRINKAAASFLKVDEDSSRKKFINEVVRSSGLIRFIRDALKTDNEIDTEIMILEQSEQTYKIRGSALLNAEGRQIGSLIVLHNITDIKRLEQMRQDFVANVSHELKTPITSIKGFVETLSEEYGQNPEKTKQFLEITARQTDRLNSIIDDLLKLSRIEKHKEDEDIELEPQDILPVLESAVNICLSLAGQKNISLNIDCSSGLKAAMDSRLMQQAVINLIDNAIKYSNADNAVNISAVKEADGVIIAVEDFGCGIDDAFHERLFERFYRVDKARSRKMGGTGLGLAIVKHITLLHNGSVSVKSAPGEGSTFTIALPAVD